MTLWGYHNGLSSWSDTDYAYGGAVTDYESTAGNPQGGPTISLLVFANGGGFLPMAVRPSARMEPRNRCIQILHG